MPFIETSDRTSYAKASVEERWKRIDRAFHRGEELPAVSLYKVGADHRNPPARKRTATGLIQASTQRTKDRR